MEWHWIYPYLIGGGGIVWVILTELRIRRLEKGLEELDLAQLRMAAELRRRRE